MLRIDHILFVFVNGIPQRTATAGILCFLCGCSHTSADILRKLFRVVSCHTFNDGFQDDTGNEGYMHGFEKIFKYCEEHFADPGHPEWYGHLHRDGTPISQIKGSAWKGPFHNVRAYMVLSQLFEKIKNGEKIGF